MASIPLKEIAPLLRVTIGYWYSDRAPRMGAALAYYMALSLAPTLVIMLAVAGFAFSAKASQGGLIRTYTNRFGSKSHIVLLP